ncbi:MAG: hypothetical protein MJ202_05320 [Lentisphaeria bacterium]|nr:hypothetical protein [Lentisphaeria bacterium]
MKKLLCLLTIAGLLMNGCMLTDSVNAATPVAPAAPEARLAYDIDGDAFGKCWQKLSNLRQEFPDVVAGHDETFFKRHTKSFARKAFEIIASDAGLQKFNEIKDLQNKTAANQTEIDNLNANRLGYPNDSSNPFAMTRDKCDKKIAELTQRNGEYERAIKTKAIELRRDLNRYGEIIDEKYLDYLIVSAEGENVLQLINTANILKQIQFAIKQQLERGGSGNGAQIEQYTGIYLVLLMAWNEAHEVALDNISKNYLPKLQKLRAQAVKNQEEAQQLIKTNPNERAGLEANIRINDNTIRVADTCNRILLTKKDELAQSQEKVASKIAVAQNTYNTVKTGTGILQLINDASQEYEAVLNFEPPVLDVIYEEKMIDIFKEVSAKLKE